MNSSLVVHANYKRSGKLNQTGDAIAADLERVIALLDAKQVRRPNGATEYVWVSDVDGTDVTPTATDWQRINWAGAHVLVVSGDGLGETTTVVSQTSTALTLTGALTLSAGDRLRLELPDEVD